MKKYLLLAVVTAFFVCFYACTHKAGLVVTINKNDTTGSGNNNNNNNNGKDTTKEVFDTSVCFQRDVLPIFTGSCAISGCHDAITKKKGYDLSSYNGIISKGLVKGNSAGSKVYTVCVKGSMPQYPTPKLDSTQLSLIKRWIDKGAPNDTNCAVNCDTTKFTYSKAIVPILKSYCLSCHATAPASSSGGGIVLDNYNAVIIQVNNGKLMGDLQHQTGFHAMPLGGNQLSDCKITQFKKWIAIGALNN